MQIHRRSFLRYASLAAAGSAAGIGPFGALNAFAQGSSTDYKALVCIFLEGGNDGNNMLVPYDTAGYQNYAKLRGPLGLSQGSLLPLTGLPNFALNPNLPEIQSLFNNGKVALQANVGTLVAPTTRAQYLAGQGQLPQNLFSHIDQEVLWQTGTQGQTLAGTGWGGRIADVLQGGNSAPKYPVVTSVSGAQVFCTGASTSYSTVIPGNYGQVACTEKVGCDARLAAAQQMLTFNSGLTLVQADNELTSNAYSYSTVLNGAVQSASPMATQFPANNSLASQLQQIAQIIQVRSALGTGRQIFFASLQGFDTHFNQLAVQSPLLVQMSQAMSAFYQATEELGVSSQVTSFTMSDFARALTPNSASGSDHAWGGHHIVMGGAVKGGKLYGTYPTLALGGPDDMGSTGRWIPTTSAAQYAATLASWFGVADSDLNSVLPVLYNFQTRNLGFV
jgi:uncharacterized protein (DUF1501 family)